MAATQDGDQRPSGGVQRAANKHHAQEPQGARNEEPELPEDVVYVGPGHSSDAYPSGANQIGEYTYYQVTKWASPYLVGMHGSPEECVLLYISDLHSSQLVKSIGELRGKRLVCECPLNKPCVADALIAETFSQHVEKVQNPRIRRSPHPG